MGLESFGLIKDLVDTNPVGTDPKSQGDDHIRGIKATLKDQFPNLEAAVTATAATINAAATTSQIGRRNLLINGNFDIWQRGNSFTTTTGTTYCADRWAMTHSGTAVSISRQTSNGRYYLQISGASGNTSCWVGQRIESANLAGLFGSTITFSAELYNPSSSPTNCTFQLTRANSKDNFSSVTSVASYNFSIPPGGPAGIAYSYTFPALTASEMNGLEIRILFGSGVPAGALVGIYAAQMEKGSVATPFERLPVAEVLALCQRCYEQGQYQFSGDVTSGASYAVRTRFRVLKRAPPTITLTDGGGAYGFPAAVGASGASADFLTESRTANATVPGGAYVSIFSADAEL
jgi:hypothetical protein